MEAMLRKALALGLTAAVLLGLIPGGAVATDGATYESDPHNEDPTYYQIEHPEAVYGGSSAEGSLESALVAGSGVRTYSEANPRQVNGEIIRPGIDVSQYQGKIDWAAVADAGVEFAIIRVGYRGYGTGTLGEDDYYLENIKNAKANGLKVGVYIFSQAITPEEGAEEARFLIDHIRGLGVSIDLPLVMDYEFVATGTGRLYHANLSRQEGTDICNAFCAAAAQAGYESMVYANPTMLSTKLYRNQMGRLWLAHYTKQTTYSEPYEYWQFSSNGEIPGIKGNVDLDFWFDSGLPFEDVSSGQWFFEGISWAYSNNIINGMSQTEFAPSDTAQRAQVITMIHRLMGRPDAEGSIPYTDVGPYTWAHDAIRWGTAERIVNGSGDGKFNPANPTERQMLVTMLYRLCGEPESTEELSGYQDAGKIQSYAQNAMKWAVECGIMNGYDEGGTRTLKPAGNCTRAEVATLLRRFQEYLDKLEEEKPEEPDEPENPDESEKDPEESETPTQPSTQPTVSPEPEGTGTGNGD